MVGKKGGKKPRKSPARASNEGINALNQRKITQSFRARNEEEEIDFSHSTPTSKTIMKETQEETTEGTQEETKEIDNNQATSDNTTTNHAANKISDNANALSDNANETQLKVDDTPATTLMGILKPPTHKVAPHTHAVIPRKKKVTNTYYVITRQLEADSIIPFLGMDKEDPEKPDSLHEVNKTNVSNIRNNMKKRDPTSIKQGDDKIPINIWEQYFRDSIRKKEDRELWEDHNQAKRAMKYLLRLSHTNPMEFNTDCEVRNDDIKLRKINYTNAFVAAVNILGNVFETLPSWQEAHPTKRSEPVAQKKPPPTTNNNPKTTKRNVISNPYAKTTTANINQKKNHNAQLKITQVEKKHKLTVVITSPKHVPILDPREKSVWVGQVIKKAMESIWEISPSVALLPKAKAPNAYEITYENTRENDLRYPNNPTDARTQFVTSLRIPYRSNGSTTFRCLLASDEDLHDIIAKYNAEKHLAEATSVFHIKPTKVQEMELTRTLWLSGYETRSLNTEQLTEALTKIIKIPIEIYNAVVDKKSDDFKDWVMAPTVYCAKKDEGKVTEALLHEFRPNKKHGFVNFKKSRALPFIENVMNAQARLIPTAIIQEEYERKENIETIIVDYFNPGGLDKPLGGTGPQNDITPRELLHGLVIPGGPEQYRLIHQVDHMITNPTQVVITFEKGYGSVVNSHLQKFPLHTLRIFGNRVEEWFEEGTIESRQALYRYDEQTKQFISITEDNLKKEANSRAFKRRPHGEQDLTAATKLDLDNMVIANIEFIRDCTARTRIPLSKVEDEISSVSSVFRQKPGNMSNMDTATVNSHISMDITSEDDDDENMEQLNSELVHSPPKTPREQDTKRHKTNLDFDPQFKPPNEANFQEFEEHFDTWYADRSTLEGSKSPNQEHQKRQIYDKLITKQISINEFPQYIQPGQTFLSLMETIQDHQLTPDNPGDNRVGDNE